LNGDGSTTSGPVRGERAGGARPPEDASGVEAERAGMRGVRTGVRRTRGVRILRAADPAEGGRVVGPYLVELDESGRPRLRRESIRADREPTFAYGAAAPLRDAA
jgi:hypothetical protein